MFNVTKLNMVFDSTIDKKSAGAFRSILRSDFLVRYPTLVNTSPDSVSPVINIYSHSQKCMDFVFYLHDSVLSRTV